MTAALQAASKMTLATVGSVDDVPLLERVLDHHQSLSPPLKQAECCALANSITRTAMNFGDVFAV